MNPKYVTSLELSKQLKDTGIEQKSLFYWIVNNYPEPQKYPQLRYGKTTEAGFTHYSAFSTGELAELLPWCIHRESEMPFCLEIRKMIESADPSYEWTVRYIRGVNANEQIPFTREHLAEAMGECLLFIKNKKYI